MNNEDWIGFMRFNQNFHIDFELTEKGGNENLFLRNVIIKA